MLEFFLLTLKPSLKRQLVFGYEYLLKQINICLKPGFVSYLNLQLNILLSKGTDHRRRTKTEKRQRQFCTAVQISITPWDNMKIG